MSVLEGNEAYCSPRLGSWPSTGCWSVADPAKEPGSGSAITRPLPATGLATGRNAGVRPVVVSTVDGTAPGVVALELRDPAGAPLPRWEPGAHVDLVLPSGIVRQYSLCGDPRVGGVPPGCPSRPRWPRRICKGPPVASRAAPRHPRPTQQVSASRLFGALACSPRAVRGSQPGPHRARQVERGSGGPSTFGNIIEAGTDSHRLAQSQRSLERVIAPHRLHLL